MLHSHLRIDFSGEVSEGNKIKFEHKFILINLFLLYVWVIYYFLLLSFELYALKSESAECVIVWFSLFSFDTSYYTFKTGGISILLKRKIYTIVTVSW